MIMNRTDETGNDLFHTLAVLDDSIEKLKQERHHYEQETENAQNLFVSLLETKTSDYTRKLEKFSRDLSVKEAYIYVLEDANRALSSSNAALNSIKNSKTYKILLLLRKIVHFKSKKAAPQETASENKETTTENLASWHENKIDSLPADKRDVFMQLYELADYPQKRMINALTVRFFELDGSRFFGGGAERYLMDLKEICDELGVRFRLYQYASYEWVRFIGSMEVAGICPTKNDVNTIDSGLMKEMDALFDGETGPDSLANVYSAFNIHVKNSEQKTLGISHGIFWDNPGEHYGTEAIFQKSHVELVESARMCDKILSVDTNTCNWFQTINYDIGRSIHYIPNYVDTSEFQPRSDYLEKPKKTVITFPRRLYAPRGLYLVLDIIDDILYRYPDVEFHFVGRGYEEDTKQVQKKMDMWPDRVKWYSKLPDEMYEVYQASDIVLIPTMYSEGTSLSCLEALASGNAVIATRIGGLTDLIINDLNGMLVEPNSVAVYRALVELLENPEKLSSVKENARKTALSFTKTKWKQAWRNELADYLHKNEEYTAATDPTRIRICLSDNNNLLNPIVKKYIEKCLAAGEYVYVASDDKELRQYSYRRIQFIAPDEDLYFEFEKKTTDEEILQSNL